MNKINLLQSEILELIEDETQYRLGNKIKDEMPSSTVLDAAEIIVITQKSSISNLMRRLNIGLLLAEQIEYELVRIGVLSEKFKETGREILFQEYGDLQNHIQGIQTKINKRLAFELNLLPDLEEQIMSLVLMRKEIQDTEIQRRKIDELKLNLINQNRINQEKNLERHYLEIAIEELRNDGMEFPNDYTRRTEISQETKDIVWNRDGGKCIQCNSREKLEFDHIIPFSKGGSNTYRNIQLLCEKCNRKKGEKI